MSNYIENEKLIFEQNQDIVLYLNSKKTILRIHEYPEDYSFDFNGHGPSYIRFGIVFKESKNI